jgi:catechol 2,3-dioxygenase-like lactoylglutathione lyase family enzyme
MIVLESLHHVSICVTDLARAKAFYGDVLGLREIARPITDFPGAWYELGDRQLHLIVHEAPRTLRGTTAIDGRDGHFAFRVRDYDETRAFLELREVPFREHRQNSTPWEQIFVTDPDGNVIEFNVERVAGRR